MNRKQIINDLIEFIDKSPVNYFAVKNSIELLEKNNFKKLEENEKRKLEKGGKYFVSRDDTALIAFSVGEDPRKGFDIIGSQHG